MSKTRSSGMSAASAISWAMTPFSRSSSIGIHGRVEDQVGDHLHAQRQAAGQGAELVAGPLIAGGGVELAALGLDDLDDVAGRALAGALEDHVLQQVRPAVAVLVLPARAAADDHRQGQGLEARESGRRRCGRRWAGGAAEANRLSPWRRRGRRPSPLRRRPAGGRTSRAGRNGRRPTRGSAGATPGRGLDGLGELGRMGGGERDDRHAGRPSRCVAGGGDGRRRCAGRSARRSR